MVVVVTAHRVLVVEDDDDVRDALNGLLCDAGYDVANATNGAAALRLLQNQEAPPDLVLLDLMMPVMDGEHFLREIRQDPRLARLPVVVLTARGGTSAMANSLGANQVLRKPIVAQQLLSTVAQYVPAVSR